MPATKKLILLRHGTTGPGFRGRYVGSTDIPLDPAGSRQIEELVPSVSALNPEQCLCSPLKRAQESAKILTPELGLHMKIDPDLREVDFGRWEGRSFDEIQTLDHDLVDSWAAGNKDEFSFPEGEPLRDFRARVRRAAERIAVDAADRVLVVTHGGVIRTMICHLLELPEDRYLAFDIKPASVTIIDLLEGKGVLVGLNNPSQPGES